MKQVIFGIVSFLVMTMIFLIMMAMYGRGMRKEESVRGLSEAMDVAITELMEEHPKEFASEEEFAALLLQRLLTQMNSTSKVQVKILEADASMGILSVEVVETYKHPNGREGSVAEQRTVIWDRPVEMESDYKTVGFYTQEDVLYKEYRIETGELCTMPVTPQIEGKIFSHWRFWEGTSTGIARKISVSEEAGSREVLASSKSVPYAVTEDTKLIAVYE